MELGWSCRFSFVGFRLNPFYFSSSFGLSTLIHLVQPFPFFLFLSLLSPFISLFPFWIISGKFIPLLPSPLSTFSAPDFCLFSSHPFLTLALYSAEVTIYIVRNSKDEKRLQIFFSTFFSECLDLVCVRWDWRGWKWGVDDMVW